MRGQPLGDGASRWALPEGVDRGALIEALHRWPGVLDVVLAESTVAVWHEPGRPVDLGAFPWPRPGQLRRAPAVHTVPVRYDGEDLGVVADQLGLSVAEVVERHQAELEVRFLGFMPGFAYLGDLDPALRLPRRPTPRPRVPAGAVAIAGRRSAIYPGPSPGGWWLIGRAEVALFDLVRGPLLRPGDRVRFVEVR